MLIFFNTCFLDTMFWMETVVLASRYFCRDEMACHRNRVAIARYVRRRNRMGHPLLRRKYRNKRGPLYICYLPGLFLGCFLLHRFAPCKSSCDTRNLARSMPGGSPPQRHRHFCHMVIAGKVYKEWTIFLRTFLYCTSGPYKKKRPSIKLHAVPYFGWHQRRKKATVLITPLIPSPKPPIVETQEVVGSSANGTPIYPNKQNTVAAALSQSSASCKYAGHCVPLGWCVKNSSL